MKKTSFLLVMLLLSYEFCAGQAWLGQRDSLLFESLKDDTTQLRAILISSNGKPMALKAQHRLGYLAFKAKRYDDAEREFALAQKTYIGFNEVNEASFFLGRIAQIKGDKTKAKECYRAYLKNEKNGTWSEGAHFHYAMILASENDTDAESELRSFLAERPQSNYAKDIQFRLVRWFLKNHDTLRAITETEALIKNYPTSTYATELRYQLGSFYAAVGRKQDAEKHYTSIAADNAPNTEQGAIGQYLLGETIEKEKDYARAREEYRKTKLVHPNVKNWSVLSDYAIAYSYYNEFREKKDTSLMTQAVESFKQFVLQYPTDKRIPRAYFLLASIAMERNQTEAALKYLKGVQDFDTTKITNVAENFLAKELQAYVQLSLQAGLTRLQLLRKLGRQSDALKECDGILLQHPEFDECQLQKGMLLMDLERNDEAEAILTNLSTKNGDVSKLAQRLLKNLRGEEK